MQQAEKCIKEGIEHLRKTIDLFKQAREHYFKGESNNKCDIINCSNTEMSIRKLNEAYDFVADIVENDLDE